MKTKLIALGLAALGTFIPAEAQIYPDANWAPAGGMADDAGRDPGRTRLEENFPVRQEKLALNDDDAAEIFAVETVWVNTEPMQWTGPASGKAVINALARWIENNAPANLNDQSRAKVIVRIEPCLSRPGNDEGGYLTGVKVSFVRLGKDDPRRQPVLCFLPYLNAEKKMANVVVPAADAETLEKKLIADCFPEGKQKIVWRCRKANVRKDGLVSFGGVWVAFIHGSHLPTTTMKLPLLQAGGINLGRVITGDEDDDAKETSANENETRKK